LASQISPRLGVGVGLDGRALGSDFHALFADSLGRRRQTLGAELRLGAPVHALDRAANLGRPENTQRLGAAPAGIRQILRQSHCDGFHGFPNRNSTRISIEHLSTGWRPQAATQSRMREARAQRMLGGTR